MNFIDIHNLSFTYSSKQKPVIDTFSMQINKGEIVGVLGPSGSGKSTLLRLIAGLEQPSGGRISIAGRLMVDDNTFISPEKRGVGMVFQDYSLISSSDCTGECEIRPASFGEKRRAVQQFGFGAEGFHPE